jgi:hypothetical protein
MATAEEFTTTETRAPRIPSYIVQSILVTLLFPIVGIVALVFSSMVLGKINQGDNEGARLASERARAWAITGYWLGVISITVNIIWMFIFFSYISKS